MVVRIGINKNIYIKKNTFTQICSSIKNYHYETGGIIGIDTNGVITTFQLDEIHHPDLYEYSPNIYFLNEVINKKWSKQDVDFIGFVHSHLHNDNISQQDILYARKILKENAFMNNILIGIIDLSNNADYIKWYLIDEQTILC